MRYTLELSEEQAEIIKISLEEYFRLRMNQTWAFADSICFEGSKKENCVSDSFYDQVEQRDMLKQELENLLNTVHPMQLRNGKTRERTIETKRAQDIWQVIRHKLWKDRHGDEDDWCVDAREPMPMTNEPLPKMEKVEK